MSTETEEWRSVEGHLGYEVSDHGRVRSLDRVVTCSSGNPSRFVRGRILIPRPDDAGYVYVFLENRKARRIHRLVAEAFLGLQDGKLVDHKNLNRSDNRSGNLRPATKSQNQHNRGIPKNNTSGFKGVYRDGDRWAANITHCGKPIHLGRFPEKERAALAYDEKAIELFGEFALTNASMGLIKTA